MAIAARSTLRWFRDARLSAVECRLAEMPSPVAGAGKFGVFGFSSSCEALENLPAYLSVMFITRLPLVEAVRVQLNVPKYVPVKRFWAMMVYDFATLGVHL
ncbi:MAG: hypothetical protein WA741_27680 [Candidatus Sulfotelmatobacter sp.]